MQPGDCPSDDLLGRYVSGGLPEGDSRDVETHLGRCTACLARLDRLAAPTDPFVDALRDLQAGAPDQPPALARAIAAVTGGGAEARQPTPGSELNGYRILEELGRGGMGRVYRAAHPRLDKEVALKVLRPGMESAPILARFEAERQALARMDHPHIAKVLDGGVTEDGRPFFAMELVRGVAVTRYCDDHRLDLRRRLELFVSVCRAVQHAHQKGVIHRDLKPSNVLVAEYDGRPTVKVIDFGVSKPVDRRSAAETEVGMLVGTPEYMSPEQADLTGLDVDTRSDIYSLGVLLYELLTGDTPFRRERLRGVPVLEVLRIVREEEPTAPGVRAERVPAAVAARRGTDPGKLARAVRGELDWIVLKCLEKDRSRRYETAAALADDVQRHLADEPVEAGPPTAVYRVRKFVRRHRAAVTAAGLLVGALLAGTAGTTYGMVRAREAEGRAEEKATRARNAECAAADRLDLVLMEQRRANEETAATKAVVEFVAGDLLGQAPALAQIRAGRPVDPDLKLRTALDRAAKLDAGRLAAHPRTEAKLRHLIGRTYFALGDYAAARPHLERAWELAQKIYEPDAPELLPVVTDLAQTYQALGDAPRAGPMLAEVAERTARSAGPDSEPALQARLDQADLWVDQGRYATAGAALAPILDQARRGFGADHALTLRAEAALGRVLTRQGRYEEAEPLLAHAYETHLRRFGPDDPGTWHMLSDLASYHRRRRQFDRAEPMMRRVVAEYQRLLGHEHRFTAAALGNLGRLYADRGDFARAWPCLTESYARSGRRLGPEHPDSIGALRGVGEWFAVQKKFAQAEPFLVEVLAVSRRVRGPDDEATMAARNTLAVVYDGLGRYADAERLHRETLDSVRRVDDWLPDTFHSAYANLAWSLLRQKKPAEAEPVLREYLDAAARRGLHHFSTAYAKLQLGGILADGRRFEEAEPLLLASVEELKHRGEQVPAETLRWTTAKAARRLAELYEAQGKAAEAARWRAEQARLQPRKKP